MVSEQFFHELLPSPAFRKPAVTRPPPQQTPETPCCPILRRLSRARKAVTRLAIEPLRQAATAC